MTRQKIEAKAQLSYWKPSKPGDTIIGILDSFQTTEFKGKQQMRAVLGKIERMDGENNILAEQVMLPAHMNLTNAICQLKVGDRIEINYSGTSTKAVKKGKTPAELYDVWLLGNDSSNGQQSLLQQPPATQPAEVDVTAAFLNHLRQGLGVHDSRIEELATNICGDKQKGAFLFGMLKSSGRIVMRPDKVWVTT